MNYRELKKIVEENNYKIKQNKNNITVYNTTFFGTVVNEIQISTKYVDALWIKQKGCYSGDLEIIKACTELAFQPIQERGDIKTIIKSIDRASSL